jgi:acetyl-CoA carboxylase carboxyl transferase subunit beta
MSTHHARSIDLLRAGAVDVIVDELPDAADEPAPFARRVADAVQIELTALLGEPAPDRLTARRQRYRRLCLSVTRAESP